MLPEQHLAPGQRQIRRQAEGGIAAAEDCYASRIHFFIISLFIKLSGFVPSNVPIINLFIVAVNNPVKGWVGITDKNGNVSKQVPSGYHVTHLSSIIQHMGDTIANRPNHQCLLYAASGQHGYFTSVQARECGFTRSLLSHQAKSGRYLRVRRGLYRLRDYPSFPREEVVAAWLAVGKDTAVVSHESALDLLELSDVTPYAIHLTVPRSRRNLPDLPGVRIHTTTKPFRALDVIKRDGIRLTSAARTILDAAEWGTGPEQIEMAIQQAIERGLATRTQLTKDASDRSKRVQDLVMNALQ